MKKKSFPVTNIGSVSLMMIFIVLCMVTFAALSLSEATSDYRYSKKMADRTSEYYAASDQAEELLARIDSALAESYVQSLASAAGTDSYYELASQALAGLDAIETDFTVREPSATYQIPVNDSQALQVELALPAPSGDSDSLYRITSWQEVNTSKWEGNTKLKLIGQE